MRDPFSTAVTRSEPEIPQFVVIICALLGLGGAISIGYGLLKLEELSQSAVEWCPETPPCPSITQTEAPETTWVVQLTGGVVKPGVYSVQPEARLASVIEQAGGFSPGADKTYVDRQLNTARQIVDGETIYIPFSGETWEVAQPNQPVKSTDTSSPNSQLTKKISVNLATQSELESLPGIGEKRASDIIQNRPYTSLTELVARKLITESLWRDIEELVTL